MTIPPASIRIACSLPLTGRDAAAGQAIRLAGETWRDRVNRGGGLAGSMVELICEDTRSEAALIPALYRRLADDAGIALFLAFDAAAVEAALPLVAARRKFLLGLRERGSASGIPYDGHIAFVHAAFDRSAALTEGLFELAARQEAPPRTVGLLSADAEFARAPMRAARENAARFGFDVVHEASYPLVGAEFASHARAAARSMCDLLVLCSYLDDGIGLIGALASHGVMPKILGGVLVGFQSVPVRRILGATLAGFVNCVFTQPASHPVPPAVAQVFARWRNADAGTSAGTSQDERIALACLLLDLLERAVRATGGGDPARLSAYLRSTTFDTFIGPVRFDSRGEHVQAQAVQVQYQLPLGPEGATSGVIVSPPGMATGPFIYPHAHAASASPDHPGSESCKQQN